MGQKVNPHGLRVGINKGWDTQWYADKKDFAVYLKEDHSITEANGTKLGEWTMYGRGYIKFTFTEALKGTNGTTGASSGNKVFYGVVRPAWLGDQNRSGFTITTLGSDADTTRSMAMFMNNVSTLTGTGLVG